MLILFSPFIDNLLFLYSLKQEEIEEEEMPEEEMEETETKRGFWDRIFCRD